MARRLPRGTISSDAFRDRAITRFMGARQNLHAAMGQLQRRVDRGQTVTLYRGISTSNKFVPGAPAVYEVSEQAPVGLHRLAPRVTSSEAAWIAPTLSRDDAWAAWYTPWMCLPRTSEAPLPGVDTNTSRTSRGLSAAGPGQRPWSRLPGTATSQGSEYQTADRADGDLGRIIGISFSRMNHAGYIGGAKG